MKRADWNSNDLLRQLEDAYKGFYRQYKELKADLLCVHIGSLEDSGWNKDNYKKRTPFYSGHHLGLMGCVRLLRLMESPP